MMPRAVKCLALVLSLATGLAGCALPGPLGEPVEKTFRSTPGGDEQKYVVMLPDGFDAGRQYDILIVLHGHGSDRWQYVRAQRGECKGARDVAARYGLIYVSADYRGKTSWMGPAAEADVVRLIGLLRKEYRVRHLLLAGASMGGTSSLIFAALHPGLVDGVVSQNGTANMMEYDKFQGAISASYGGDKTQKPEEYRKRSPERTPERFTMPIALCVGGKDTTVPPDSVRRLYARLRELGRKDLLLIDRPDGGHSSSYEDTVAALEFAIHAVRARGAHESEKHTDGKPDEPGEADGPEDDGAQPAP